METTVAPVLDLQTIPFWADRIIDGEILSYELIEEFIQSPKGSEQENRFFQLGKMIRKRTHQNWVELCGIQNVRSGQCTENCKFCAQSAHYPTSGEVFPWVGQNAVLHYAKNLEVQGVQRFSMVTSGHLLEPPIFEEILRTYRLLREETNLDLCASLGRITEDQGIALRNAGVTRYHHNLETSEGFYKSICTTHTFQERVETLQHCKRTGLEVCSGGILGMGETWEDRIQLALTLRKIGVDSIPLNVLVPIAGTPLEGRPLLSEHDILKTLTLFKLLNPHSVIRYAGGRGQLKASVESGLQIGASAMITGDLLTTVGSGTDQDKMDLTQWGYVIKNIPINTNN